MPMGRFMKRQNAYRKTYDMNEKIALPLPKNAVAGDLTISVTVKNSSNELSTEEVGIKGVTLPTFDALYLALDNNLVYTMEKDGNVFSVEDFIPAGATGKIYANSNKTGMSWGMEGDEIIALGKTISYSVARKKPILKFRLMQLVSN